MLEAFSRKRMEISQPITRYVLNYCSVKYISSIQIFHGEKEDNYMLVG